MRVCALAGIFLAYHHVTKMINHNFLKSALFQNGVTFHHSSKKSKSSFIDYYIPDVYLVYYTRDCVKEALLY